MNKYKQKLISKLRLYNKTLDDIKWVGTSESFRRLENRDIGYVDIDSFMEQLNDDTIVVNEVSEATVIVGDDFGIVVEYDRDIYEPVFTYVPFNLFEDPIDLFEKSKIRRKNQIITYKNRIKREVLNE